ncbi:MAG: S24/S26 family peptidase [Lachnospiraceae bacterium]|nr:S24/S26 family peptidase [Lachnospiraceae bacterium]
MSELTFEEILARDGVLAYMIRGISMEPMLRQGRDLVVIRVPSSRLKKYDTALYRRGDSYVLHRVLAVKDGYYLIRGDNTYVPETVPDSAVIGVLTSFRRKGKEISADDPAYRFYARFWHAIYPLRVLRIRFRRSAAAALRKLGVLPIIKKILSKDGA